MASKNFRVQSTYETFQTLYNAITTARPFIYSRYGDGDFNVMVSGHDDSSQVASMPLAIELADLLIDESPNNLVGICMHEKEPGMEPGLLEGWDNPIFVDWVNEYCVGREFYNAIALHYYCICKSLDMRHFLFQLRKVPNKIFVGSISRELVESVLGPLEHYIPTEDVDCYNNIEQWWPEVAAATSKSGLVIGAAGLSTRAMNQRLLVAGFEGQSLDLGSTLDFLIGNENRTWITMAGPMARRRVLCNV